jgi:hypothetical protein
VAALRRTAVARGSRGRDLQIEVDLSSVKLIGQTLLDLRVGRVPTPVTEIVSRLENELGPTLQTQGIRFIVEIKSGVRPVYAEPCLLRGLVYTLIDNSRRRLTGAGASIFDNLIAVSNALNDPARFLSWPLERRLTDVPDKLMQSVVEYFQGRWEDDTRETIGTGRAIVLTTTQ